MADRRRLHTPVVKPGVQSGLSLDMFIGRLLFVVIYIYIYTTHIYIYILLLLPLLLL